MIMTEIEPSGTKSMSLDGLESPHYGALIEERSVARKSLHDI